MATKFLSSGFNFSTLPEKYVRSESQRSRLSEVSDGENVPVIDLASPERNFCVQQIANACQNYGFFQVINHEVKAEAVERMLEVEHEFSRLPVEKKMKLYSDDPSKTTRLLTSFNINKEQVHKDVPVWPSNPRPFKYCEFHRDYGHDTDNCFELREEIKSLIRRGYSGEYGGVGQGGSSGNSRKISTREGRAGLLAAPPGREVYNLEQGRNKVPKTDDYCITFTETEARKVFPPYDDALIISLCISDKTVSGILVDDGSAVNIICKETFDRLDTRSIKLDDTSVRLTDFVGHEITTTGSVRLRVSMGDAPAQVTREVEFLIVNGRSSYNAIFGRPALRLFKAVPSTYHGLIKFPTDRGLVGQVQRDGHSRRCIPAMVQRSQEVGQTMMTSLDLQVAGLQGLKDGKWVAVNPQPNAFVINNGDQLEALSNGRHKSLRHRATVNADKPGMSIASFFCRSDDAVISAPKSPTEEDN